VINLKQNEQQQNMIGNAPGKSENRSSSSENYIISLFYQIVNENKLLKQETVLFFRPRHSKKIFLATFT